MSRIELAKIPSLTFYRDSLTTARRTRPIQQLICKGTPCKLYQPEVVRCTNLPGGRGTEVDWKVRHVPIDVNLRSEALDSFSVKLICQKRCDLDASRFHVKAGQGREILTS